MPIGTFISNDSSIGCFKKLVHKIFGTIDIHTHTRLRPLLKFIKKNRNLFENATILEPGCGSGINLFETFYINNSIRAVGIDIDCYSIKLAESLSKNLGISKYLKFYCVICAN